MAVAQKQPRLSDGREMRALQGRFTQAQMFELGKNGLYNPKTEGIATVRQLDDALNISRIYQAVLGDSWSRALEFAFYRRGFEKDLTLQMGKKLVWIEKEKDLNQKETGRLLIAILDLSKIADVPVTLANGSKISLQKAAGMGIIPISKLEIRKTEDNKKLIAYEVSIASDFNPATDLKVKNAARPRVWSDSVDEDGFALNDGRVSDQVGWDIPSARFSSVRHSDEFLDISKLPSELQAILTKMGIKPEDLGYSGSVGRYVYYSRRYVYAGNDWSGASGVAIVGREATAPQLEAPKEKLVEIVSPDLILRIPDLSMSQLRTLISLIRITLSSDLLSAPTTVTGHIQKLIDHLSRATEVKPEE